MRTRLQTPLLKISRQPDILRADCWRKVLACLVLLIVACSTTHAREPQPKLATINVEINDVSLEVEVAATGLERNRGLSYRKHLDSDAGMLFVYQQERPLIFTMRETSIPLSIAFISADLVINEIHKMEPWATQNYPSKIQAQYALEVNQGWFERNGIKAGDRIKLLRE